MNREQKKNPSFGPTPTWLMICAWMFIAGCSNDTGPTRVQKRTDVGESKKDKYDQKDLRSKFAKDAPAEPGFTPYIMADAFPPITEIKIKPADQVDQQRIPDDELVLGVTIDGESRAYPLVQLCGAHREVINDQLGGTSIAATW